MSHTTNISQIAQSPHLPNICAQLTGSGSRVRGSVRDHEHGVESQTHDSHEALTKSALRERLVSSLRDLVCVWMRECVKENVCVWERESACVRCEALTHNQRNVNDLVRVSVIWYWRVCCSVRCSVCCSMCCSVCCSKYIYTRLVQSLCDLVCVCAKERKCVCACVRVWEKDSVQEPGNARVCDGMRYRGE